MKKQIYLLLGAVIIILLVVSTILFSYNKGLNNRINVISKSIERISSSDSTYVSMEVEKMRFKEDYYIQQQSKDTALILTVFGLITIVFGYLSFNSFRKEVENVVDEIQKNYDVYVEKYKNQEHNLKVLGNDIKRIYAFSAIDGAKKDLKEGDMVNYTIFQLTALKHLCDIFENPVGKPDSFVEYIKSAIDTEMLNLHNNIYNLKEPIGV